MRQVRCHVHGLQQETLVCQHIVEGLRNRKRVGFFWMTGDPDNARPDACCSACEERVRATGGEWIDEALEHLQAKVLCGACYDVAKLFHTGEIPGLSERRPHANMLRIIEATLSSESEPAFETPGEAIDFSKSIDRTRHPSDMASCVGRIIRAADWRDDSFSLHLDNRKVLQFGCAKYDVDVIIGDDPPSTVVGGPKTQEVVLVQLKGKGIHWKRDELMRALPSHAVNRIQMGQSGLFLYVTKVGILAVSVLIDRSTSRPFLFWEMVD